MNTPVTPMTPVEVQQLKILYAAVYSSLGLVDRTNEVDNVAYKLRHGEIPIENTTGLKLYQLFPKQSRLVAAFTHEIHNLSPLTALDKWRWLTRDSSDKFLLRFIRRYRDLVQAIESLGFTINVHAGEHNAARELMRGERYYTDADPEPAYIEQFKSQKVAICGQDRAGRPVFLATSKHHIVNKQSREVNHRFTTYIVELLNIIQRDDFYGVTTIWDLDGFSMENIDLDHIRLIITLFQRCSPMLTRCCFIHRAPTLFKGIWRLIHKWVDPGVANLIQFTNSVEDLEKEIALDNIPKSLGGTSEWESIWIDPTPEDDILLRDFKGRHKLLTRRSELTERIEALTRSWIVDNDLRLAEREECMELFRQNYWMLDPYVRARTIWDRQGILAHFRPEMAPGGLAHPQTALSQLSAPAEMSTAASSRTLDGSSISSMTSMMSQLGIKDPGSVRIFDPRVQI